MSRPERSEWQRKPVRSGRFIPCRTVRGFLAAPLSPHHRRVLSPSARGRTQNTPRDRIPISKASSLQSHRQMGVVMLACRGAGSLQDGIDGIDVGWQLVDGIELVAPGSVAALDGSIHLRTLGRQDVEANALVLTGLLEVGHEFRAAVDLDGGPFERHVAYDLVEEERGRSRGGAVEGLGDGPLGDRVVSGEMLDGLAGRDVDESGIELNEAAWAINFEIARQPYGEAPWQTTLLLHLESCYR